MDNVDKHSTAKRKRNRALALSRAYKLFLDQEAALRKLASRNATTLSIELRAALDRDLSTTVTVRKAALNSSSSC